MTSFLRAEQAIWLYNFFLVSQKYGSVFFGITAIIIFLPSIELYLAIQALVTVLTGIIIFFIFLIKNLFHGNFFNKYFKQGVNYGIFYAFSELGYLFLNFADRYLIQFF